MKHLTTALILTLLLVIVVNIFIFQYNFWLKPSHPKYEVPEIRIVVDEIILIPNLTKYREISAYNAGDPNQCDSSPCIAANGENVCTAIALGYKRCAANFVPFGTILDIEHYGECLVVDRMNRRFPNRVDIAMPADQKDRALQFGLQNLLVVVK